MKRLSLIAVTAILGVTTPAAAQLDRPIGTLTGACLALANTLDLDRPAWSAPMPVSSCRIASGCLEVDWNIASTQKLGETLAMFRFTEKTPLKVRTSNLNYLVYTVKWTKTVERQDAAFESVSQIFEKVFPILSLLGGTTEVGGTKRLSEKLAAWVTPLEQAHLCLSDTTARYTNLVLDSAGTTNRERLNDVRYAIAKGLPELARRRLDYLNEHKDEWPIEDLNNYWKVAQRHSDFEQRAGEFIPLARASVEGVETVLETDKRNSIVLLSGAASKRGGEPVSEPVIGRYFVAWSKPVLYHVGYGYGRLRDFDFTQVRTQAGQDVFAATNPENDERAAETGQESGTAEPVAFLTYEFKAQGPNDRYGIGLTFGTGLSAPGESLYYGGTLRVFGRLAITGGWVSAMSTRGDKPIVDVVTSASVSSPGAVRTLFAELKEKVSTRPFGSISFRVY